MFCQFQKVCELLFFGTMREKMFCQFQKTCKLLFFGTMRAILVRIVPKQTIWAGLCLQSESSAFAKHFNEASGMSNRVSNPLQKSSAFAKHFNEASGIRTPDNLIKSQVLYRLS